MLFSNAWKLFSSQYILVIRAISGNRIFPWPFFWRLFGNDNLSYHKSGEICFKLSVCYVVYAKLAKRSLKKKMKHNFFIFINPAYMYASLWIYNLFLHRFPLDNDKHLLHNHREINKFALIKKRSVAYQKISVRKRYFKCIYCFLLLLTKSARTLLFWVVHHIKSHRKL